MKKFVLCLALALGPSGCATGMLDASGVDLNTMWASTEITVLNGTPYTCRVTASGKPKRNAARVIEPGNQAVIEYTNYFRDPISIGVTVVCYTGDKKVIAGTDSRVFYLATWGRYAEVWHVTYLNPPRSS